MGQTIARPPDWVLPKPASSALPLETPRAYTHFIYRQSPHVQQAWQTLVRGAHGHLQEFGPETCVKKRRGRWFSVGTRFVEFAPPSRLSAVARMA